MLTTEQEKEYKEAMDAYHNEIDTKWNIKPRNFFEQFGTDIMQFDIYKYLPSLKISVPQRKFWVLSLIHNGSPPLY
jgi:hypothetical protein